MRIAGRCITIWPTNFGPHFLQKHDPDLIADRSTKHGPIGPLEYWNVVINDHLFVDALINDLHPINAFRANFHRMAENSFDPLGHLCNWGETCQEIAIPGIALLNVSWIDGVRNNLGIGDNFCDSFPSDFPVIDGEVEGCLIGWKGAVNKLFTLLFAGLQLFLVVGRD